MSRVLPYRTSYYLHSELSTPRARGQLRCAEGVCDVVPGRTRLRYVGRHLGGRPICGEWYVEFTDEPSRAPGPLPQDHYMVGWEPDPGSPADLLSHKLPARSGPVLREGTVVPRTLSYLEALRLARDMDQLRHDPHSGHDEDRLPGQEEGSFWDPIRLSRYRGGCVYFVQTSTHVKIGWSATLLSRLRQLQCGSAERLTVAAIAPSDTPEAERWAHQVVLRERFRGEWFRRCLLVDEFVRIVAETYHVSGRLMTPTLVGEIVRELQIAGVLDYRHGEITRDHLGQVDRRLRVAT